MLLILTLGILQVLYAIIAYKKQENKIEAILNYVLNFSFSILLVGIQFTIMHWVGFRVMVNAGLFLLIISSTATIIYRIREKEENLITNNLIRAVAIFSLFVVTYFGSAKNNSTNQDIETQNGIEKLQED